MDSLWVFLYILMYCQYKFKSVGFDDKTSYYHHHYLYIHVMLSFEVVFGINFNNAFSCVFGFVYKLFKGFDAKRKLYRKLSKNFNCYF